MHFFASVLKKRILYIMSKYSYPTLGLALGSGGAKGLSHIGVLKTLEKYDIDINYIAGSSIGSLIGAYYAAYPNLSDLEELVFSFNKRKGFMLFDPILRGGLLAGNKIEKFISDMLEDATFEKLRIPFIAVATDISSAEEVLLSKGSLTKAVRASISVPAIFQPIHYQGKLLADGGLSDPVPTQVARSMGSDIVIAVNVESTYFLEPLKKIPALSHVPMHSVNILRHNLTAQSLNAADIVIAPRVPPIGLVGWDYFFDTSKAQKMIAAGEHATEKIIPQLKRLIEKKKNERRGLRKIFSFFKKRA